MHLTAPAPLKHDIIFLFSHELRHRKTSNVKFFFPLFSFLSSCRFSFSSLTYIYYPRPSLDVYQFVSLMSASSEGRGHRALSLSWRDDDLARRAAARQHRNTHQKDLPPQSTAPHTHTHTLFGYFFLSRPIIHSLFLPLERRSRETRDRERQRNDGSKKKKG